MHYVLCLTNNDRYTIIDEADEMVSSDWVDDMRKLMTGGGQYSHLSSTGFTSSADMLMPCRQ